MHRVLCSTGALLGVPNGRNYYLLPECAERLRCDGYEFMLYSAWYDQLDRLSALLSRLRLPVYVYHCEKHIGEAISRNGPGDWEEAARLFAMDEPERVIFTKNCTEALNLAIAAGIGMYAFTRNDRA